MDQGGELGWCPDIITLFETAGYSVKLTAPDSSHQNGPGEWPHCTIGDAIRTMLAGTGLKPHFWPYAFCHFLHLYNVAPHHVCNTSSYTLCLGQLPNLTLLCTFGCQVYVLPPCASCWNKLHSDTHTGIFLGYLQTMKNILYYDQSSHQVKTALYVVFDKAMSDSDIESPNAWLLCGDTNLPADIINTTSRLPFLDISTLPFTSLVNIDFLYNSHNSLPLGIEVSTCMCLCHAYHLSPPPPLVTHSTLLITNSWAHMSFQ